MVEHPDPRPREPERDERTGRSAAVARIQHQNHWVEQQIRRAQERGDFEGLPGLGKPLQGLGTEHDPDWWLKKLVEREQVTGVLPPALQLRKDDAELDTRLDSITDESRVREAVEEFNAAVRKALYTPPGPHSVAFPVVTRQRDVDAEVVRWRARRTQRREAQRALLTEHPHDASPDPAPTPHRWWRRRG
ncbi:DUF1992 domain-containing protein [Nocardioides gilvus]|uniref:DnaJ family domain-containing protein n=1 Tax=Nocardioides gilvus TaxID=1735589 RepID=UPI000D74A264|nr:DUF1992 domain-containing protein [Nocardioides gilvus]